MSYQLAEYPLHSRKLIDAGRNLLDALDDDDLDTGLAVTDLETATRPAAGIDLRQRFTAPTTPTAPAAPAFAKPDAALSAVLLELQSANVLMAAGIAMNEHASGAKREFLNDAIAKVTASRSAVEGALASAATMRFAAPSKPSASVEDAVNQFRDNSGKTLAAIAEGTASVIDSVFEQLKRLDGTKVLEAINQMGDSLDVVKAAGRLIRQGLEKLKAVLDTLSRLFGPEAFADVKAKVQEMWQNFTSGDYTQQVVRRSLGTTATEARVAEIAALEGLSKDALDGVSRDLASLEDDYQGTLKVLNGLVAGIVVAMGILAFLNLAGPWVALAGAGAYVGVLGAALVVGRNYTGSAVFAATRGVLDVIEGAQAGMGA